MVLRFVSACMSVAMLCACAERSGDEAEEWPEATVPIYGPVREFDGYWTAGQESSVLYVCEGPRQQCSTRFDNDEGCWAEFTDQSWREFSDLADQQKYETDGAVSFWVKGSGRQTEQRGNFGHMGYHSCQIEVTSVHSIEPYDMFNFSPPTP